MMQVYKAINAHRPPSSNQLELQEGYYFYIDPEKSIDSSTDLWIEGTSWLSGLTGQIQSKNLMRTATTAVWTCYKYIELFFFNYNLKLKYSKLLGENKSFHLI